MTTTASVPGTELEHSTTCVPTNKLECLIAHIMEADELLRQMRGERWMKEMTEIWTHVGEAKYYAVELERYIDDPTD